MCVIYTRCGCRCTKTRGIESSSLYTHHTKNNVSQIWVLLWFSMEHCKNNLVVAKNQIWVLPPCDSESWAIWKKRATIWKRTKTPQVTLWTRGGCRVKNTLRLTLTTRIHFLINRKLSTNFHLIYIESKKTNTSTSNKQYSDKACVRFPFLLLPSSYI